MADEQAPPGVDPTIPSPARIYDYYLGGTHHYQADRDAAKIVRDMVPEWADVASAMRGFHQRAARCIAQHGIRQFIDIGSGLPTVGNTHEVVQKIHPRTRVAYVDNDPTVPAYADELLDGNRNTALIHADLRQPGTLLSSPELRALIDFSQPVGLLMTAVLHFVSDAFDPWALVRRYMDALAPGSYLALSHGTADALPPKFADTICDVYSKATENVYWRSKAEIERFFDGLEIIPPYEGADPHVCFIGLFDMHPDTSPEEADNDSSHWCYCAVARK